MMIFRFLRRHVLELALSLILAATSVGFEARATGDIEIPNLMAFDGNWERVDQARDEVRRVAAIDRAVGSMSWLIRGFAGRVLRKSTRPPSEIKFIWDGSELQELARDQSEEQYRPIRLDGHTRLARDDHGEVSLSWHPAPQGMRLHWKQHQAHGSNVYRIEEARDILIVEHTIQVTALSNIEPIVYQSHFMRRELPHISAAPNP